MIKLIATAESVEQGTALLEAGVDRLIIGESEYGLRLPKTMTFEEMGELIDIAHQQDKEVVIAANAILHNDKINRARDYLQAVRAIHPDLLMVGDTGLIQIMKEPSYAFPYIYDAGVLVTSPGQVNFWAQFGAVGALVAREVPLVELRDMAPESNIPLMVQVYGATCIHQSGRPLLENYYNYVEKDTQDLKHEELFLSEPRKKETHYSIFQDSHGTHIYASDDLNLLPHLNTLKEIGIQEWYMDGIYTRGEAFVQIAQIFNQARKAIENKRWTEELAEELSAQVVRLHPENRELSTGFFFYDRETVQ